MSPFKITLNNVTTIFLWFTCPTNKEEKQGDNILSWDYLVKLICIIDRPSCPQEHQKFEVSALKEDQKHTGLKINSNPLTNG